MSLPWAQVAKQHWLTAFVGGVFLLVLGTTKGIPAWGLAADPPFHYVLIGVGVLVLIVALFFMWTAFQPTTTQTTTFDPKKYFSTITSPGTDDLKRLPPVTVKGKLKRALPDDIDLCLFNEDAKGGAKTKTTFWPQRSMKINKLDWSSVYTPAEYEDGHPRTLRLYFVGKDGQTFIALWREINQRLPKGEDWTGITAPTRDMQPASERLHLTLLKPPIAKPQSTP